VLEWPNITNNQDIVPKIELVVNTVAISSQKYVKGGRDNNLVCIWKQKDDATGDDTEVIGFYTFLQSKHTFWLYNSCCGT